MLPLLRDYSNSFGSRALSFFGDKKPRYINKGFYPFERMHVMTTPMTDALDKSAF